MFFSDRDDPRQTFLVIRPWEGFEGWDRRFFDAGQTRKGAGLLKKLEIRDKWKIDVDTFRSQQKLHKFFNDHHEIKFSGDREGCREVYQIWKEDINENKRKAKEKFKEEYGAMDKFARSRFVSSLRDELKRTYIKILQKEDMKPKVFVKKHQDLSDDHQFVLYNSYEQLEKLYETHLKVETNEPLDEHPWDTLRYYIENHSSAS